MTILMAKQVSQKFMALTKIYHVINPIIYIYVLHPPRTVIQICHYLLTLILGGVLI